MGRHTQFHTAANLLYPGWQKAQPCPRIGVMSLMLPVGCNATCPNICYTDAENWRRKSEHLTTDQLQTLINEFAKQGGRLVRIIGDGEPLLYREMATLCQWIRDANMQLVVFSNGVAIPQTFLQEYERGSVWVYLKLWSEREAVQQKLVAPRTPYVYCHGEMGLAPQSFYQLWQIQPARVGFQVMVSSINAEDVTLILSGPKRTLPMLVEPFIAHGAGKGHDEFKPQSLPPSTKACSKPPRSSYLAVVNSQGQLQPGTFIPKDLVSVKKGQLLSVWQSVFATKTLFYRGRYEEGCLCEKFHSEQ
ncbi:radical SAM protein [Candidatus Uhrbacteria bacterium]|nr:radical SAM protein [Candidatus Uhrbacteria bacterium]